MTSIAGADGAGIVEPRDPDEVVDVQRAATGDGQAFERVYRRHVAAVRRVVQGRGQHQDADDVTQEVFVRAWRELPKFRRDAAFRTWITRIAVNAVTDCYRSTTSSHRRLEQLTTVHVDMPAHVPIELKIAVRRVIATLPGRDRKIMVMYHVMGYRLREISGRLGMPVGTIKSLLHRTRRLLRDQLAPVADRHRLACSRWRVSHG